MLVACFISPLLLYIVGYNPPGLGVKAIYKQQKLPQLLPTKRKWSCVHTSDAVRAQEAPKRNVHT